MSPKTESKETSTTREGKVRFDPFANPGTLAEQEAAWLNEQFPGLNVKASHVRAVISNHTRFQKSDLRRQARDAERAKLAEDREARKAAAEQRKADAEQRKAEREQRKAERAAKAAAKAAEKPEAKPAAKKAAPAKAAPKPAPKKRVSRPRKRTGDVPAEDAF
ncbi:membrane protein [Mycobacterium phage Benzema]|nr:membrane protein [Mycobacterium phage Benzema]